MDFTKSVRSSENLFTKKAMYLLTYLPIVVWTLLQLPGHSKTSPTPIETAFSVSTIRFYLCAWFMNALMREREREREIERERSSPETSVQTRNHYNVWIAGDTGEFRPHALLLHPISIWSPNPIILAKKIEAWHLTCFRAIRIPRISKHITLFSFELRVSLIVIHCIRPFKH